MLIAVISDSHGNKESIEKLQDKISNVQVLLFLGDGEKDLKEITKNFNGEIYAVRGNCDFEGIYPEERVIEIEDKKIFMCHGHRYGVKYGYNSIFYRGKELEVDIVLFGHTHLPIIDDEDGLILMNPGSVSHGIGDRKKTVGYINLDDKNNPILYIDDL